MQSGTDVARSACEMTLLDIKEVRQYALVGQAVQLPPHLIVGLGQLAPAHEDVHRVAPAEQVRARRRGLAARAVVLHPQRPARPLVQHLRQDMYALAQLTGTLWCWHTAFSA